jgi:glucosamine--fructose-6-phosphate aminotransferase (isomerizing)
MNAFQSEAVTEADALHGLIGYYSATGAAAIRDAARLFHDRGCRRVVFAGMGSSYSAPFAVLDELIAGGIPATALTAYKLGQDRAVLVSPETLVVAISKSGTTKEVLELVHSLGPDPALIGIVNELDSDLAKRSSVNLPMRAGIETQIASKSFLCTLAVLNLLSAELTGNLNSDRLSALHSIARWAQAYFDQSAHVHDRLPESIKSCTYVDVIATGASLGTAYKSALVLREVPKVIAGAIDCADFAHGWAKITRAGYLGIVLAPEYRTQTIEERAVNQILSRGGDVVLITSNSVPINGKVTVLQHPVLPDSVAPLAQAVILDAMIGAMANVALR